MLTIIQTILAVLLIAAILIQQRGAGLSGTFGGEGSVYSTRRGIEKIIFIATIVLAILFFGFSIARILL
ncbi:MAG: preprotein translocase subunit SecG [Patescibacteria group bacterium]